MATILTTVLRISARTFLFIFSFVLFIHSVAILMLLIVLQELIGKGLKELFDPTKRYPSILVPVWWDFPDQLPFDDFWGSGINLVKSTLAFTSLVCFQGMITALYLNKTTATSLAALIVLTVVQGSVAFTGFNGLDSMFNSEMRSNIKHVLNRHYNVLPGNPQTTALNLIMIKGSCCGVDGVEDFRDVNLTVQLVRGVDPYANLTPYSNKQDWFYSYPIPTLDLNFTGTFKIPPVCCKDEIFTARNETVRFLDVIKCAMEGKPDQYNTVGCYTHYYESRGKTLLNDMFGVGMTHMVTTTLMITLILCLSKSKVPNKGPDNADLKRI